MSSATHNSVWLPRNSFSACHGRPSLLARPHFLLAPALAPVICVRIFGCACVRACVRVCVCVCVCVCVHVCPRGGCVFVVRPIPVLDFGRYGYEYVCEPGTAPTARYCPIPFVPFRGVNCSDAAGTEVRA